MNSKLIVTTAGVFLMLLGHQVSAQDGEDADEPTMRLMSNAEATLPAAVTNIIKLPADLVDNAAAVDNAKYGISVANDNRSRPNAGLTTVDEARNRAKDMTEAAQDDRETHGRTDELPDPPQRPVTPKPQGGN